MCKGMDDSRRAPGLIHSLGPVLALASALLALGITSGCSSTNGPTGDPVRLSESEFDIAADLWRRQGDAREALKHALRAVELDGENGDAAHLVSLLYLDFCQNGQSDECRLAEAEKYARIAIESSRETLGAKNTLAVIHIHQKRYDEAIRLLKPITENILYPTPELAWGNLGWAYIEKGQLPEAIRSLERSVAAQPLFCVGNFRLGVALHASGRLEAALEALDRALETDAPGCGNLQDAYLERARVHLGLGDIELTRADLDRCITLQKSNLSGKTCAKLLTTL